VSVMEDLAGLFQRGPWWKTLSWAADGPDSREPVTLAFDKQHIQISMACPRCARSMRLISSPPERERRTRPTLLSWHCETCGIESQRTVQC
jgi:transposase-like protein